MENSWVKLYRKLNDNELIFDEKALKVFIWLLLNADKDGKRRISKYRTSEAIKMNPETFIKVLKRLKNKYGVIHSTATSQYTEITLLNWDKYQSKDSTALGTAPTKYQPSTYKVPAQHQPSTTSTRIRIENKKENTNRESLPVIKTSKNSLLPCNETELQEISDKLSVPIEAVKGKHERILEMIEAREFNNRKHKTMYFTLKSWIDLDVKKGYIKSQLVPGIIHIS